MSEKLPRFFEQFSLKCQALILKTNKIEHALLFQKFILSENKYADKISGQMSNKDISKELILKSFISLIEERKNFDNSQFHEKNLFMLIYICSIDIIRSYFEKSDKLMQESNFKQITRNGLFKMLKIVEKQKSIPKEIILNFLTIIIQLSKKFLSIEDYKKIFSKVTELLQKNSGNENQMSQKDQNDNINHKIMEKEESLNPADFYKFKVFLQDFNHCSISVIPLETRFQDIMKFLQESRKISQKDAIFLSSDHPHYISTITTKSQVDNLTKNGEKLVFFMNGFFVKNDEFMDKYLSGFSLILKQKIDSINVLVAPLTSTDIAQSITTGTNITIRYLWKKMKKLRSENIEYGLQLSTFDHNKIKDFISQWSELSLDFSHILSSDDENQKYVAYPQFYAYNIDSSSVDTNLDNSDTNLDQELNSTDKNLDENSISNSNENLNINSNENSNENLNSINVDDIILENNQFGYWLNVESQNNISFYLDRIMTNYDLIIKFQPKPIIVHILLGLEKNNFSIHTFVVDCIVKISIIVEQILKQLNINFNDNLGFDIFLLKFSEQTKLKPEKQFAKEMMKQISQLILLDLNKNLFEQNVIPFSYLRIITYQKMIFEQKEPEKIEEINDKTHFWDEMIRLDDPKIVTVFGEIEKIEKQQFQEELKNRKESKKDQEKEANLDIFFQTKATSFNEAIKLITTPKTYSHFFEKMFIWVLPLITKEEELFVNKLIQRFYLPKSISIDSVEMEEIRLLIASILKRYIRYKCKINFEISEEEWNLLSNFTRNDLLRNSSQKLKNIGLKIELMMMKYCGKIREKKMEIENESNDQIKEKKAERTTETEDSNIEEDDWAMGLPIEPNQKHFDYTSQTISDTINDSDDVDNDDNYNNDMDDKNDNEKIISVFEETDEIFFNENINENKGKSVEDLLVNTINKSKGKRDDGTFLSVFLAALDTVWDDKKGNENKTILNEENEDFLQENLDLSESTSTNHVSMNEYFIFTTNVNDFAKQLSLVSLNNFRKIQIQEFFFGRWIRHKIIKNPENEKICENVLKMINNFNRLSDWVSLSILQEPKREKRVRLICRFTKLCDALRSLENYQDLMAVFSGLQNSSVFRLKNTWRHVPDKYRQILKDLDELTSVDRFKNLRNAHHNSKSAIVPYLGIYLSDFTILDEVPNRVVDDLINWGKFRRFFLTFYQISCFQKAKYRFLFNENLHNLFMLIPSEKVDPKLFLDLSLKIEPIN
ncbi:guanine nucleotide exchange factor [Anaeramoeba ignava]|uniref:Guanine nucleotide exchange factor n=1 Tax=Anaeramoeba ignava TaxID=1746090 RepID=A0A9Q0LFE9_ANAIG|nr:guanine nucleotide exchange factor [Anaeramoeba ignava]